MSLRRNAALLATLLPLAAMAACSASNGDAIPGQVYDASALDVASPEEPDGSGSRDAEPSTDAGQDATEDAKGDAAPPAATARIGEIYVDHTNSYGDGAEYVELRGKPGEKVDDLSLRLIDATGAVKYEVSVGDPGDAINADGLWTVGGLQTFKIGVNDHVDHIVDINSWGLDNSRGAVQLVRGTQRELVDVLGYDTTPDAGAGVAQPASPPKATVEGKTAYVGGAANKSIGRATGAADTNDNAKDFCVMTATPGHAQAACD